MINSFARITILLIAVGITSAFYAQKKEWEKLVSPVSTILSNLSFVSSTTGWASGGQGTIIKTSDGGMNWQIQNSNVPSFITDIHFIDENYGWAVTVKEVFPFNTVVLKTTDGGEEWTEKEFQDSSALMRTIFFFDSLNGFIGGSYIAETNDGGHTWTKATIDSSLLSGLPIYNFKFFNRQFGYACGGALDIAGVIWQTTNSGKNWTAKGVSADQVFDLYIFDSLNAVTLSGDPEGFFGMAKLRTTNAGVSWDYDSLSIYGLSFALDFRTATEGWSASGHKLLFSSNAGEAWEERTVPDSAIIYDLQFIDSLTGYAVGNEGAILKFVPPAVSVDDVRSHATGFTLFQNYPNPFNPSTTINFQITELSFVKIKIYDVLGNEISTLVNEVKPSGIYQVEFNTVGHSGEFRNLPSGIYFYQLKVYPASGGAGSFVETKKMTLLK